MGRVQDRLQQAVHRRRGARASGHLRGQRALNPVAQRQERLGAFVGFYLGEWFTPAALTARDDANRRNEYAISTSGDARYEELVVSPPVLAGGGVCPSQYPLAMANEPGPGREANCVLVEYKFLLDELAQPGLVPEALHDLEFAAVGLVCTRPVGARRELTWHYGRHYGRTYPVGRPSRLPRGVRLQDPLDVLRDGRVPNEAVCVEVETA